MDDENKISKFSSGLNIIYRLDRLWQDTHLHSRQGSFSAWNADLDRIWVELARDLEPKEYISKEDVDGKNIKKGYKVDFEYFETELKKLGSFQDSRPAGFDDLSKGDIEKRDKQYKLLMEKQLFLARLENHLGKGTTYDEEDDDF